MSEIALLNCPILTSFGAYRFTPLTTEQARALVAASPWRSAIGHEAAAWVVSRDLAISCPVERREFRQQPDDIAVVLWLRKRLPEGRIAAVTEMDEVGYDYGLLERVPEQSNAGSGASNQEHS